MLVDDTQSHTIRARRISLVRSKISILCVERTSAQILGVDTGYPHDGRADNAAYRHDRRADKRRYPHDREINVQNVKMLRN